jgi:hypothetical protein
MDFCRQTGVVCCVMEMTQRYFSKGEGLCLAGFSAQNINPQP